MDVAKVFMTGRSQAVRLPKAFRFDADEVLIEKQPDGAVVLRPKPRGLLGDRLWAVLDGLPDDPTFTRPDQGKAEVRDWLDRPIKAGKPDRKTKDVTRKRASKKVVARAKKR